VAGVAVQPSREVGEQIGRQGEVFANQFRGQSANRGKRFTDGDRDVHIMALRRAEVGWQAAGLSLAAPGVAVTHGSGGLLVAVALAPMVYVFGRLRSHAVTSRSVADLIGAVPGERVGLGAALVQGVGYLLLAFRFARTIGLLVVSELLEDPESVLNTWWWPLCSVLAPVIAARVGTTCRDGSESDRTRTAKTFSWAGHSGHSRQSGWGRQVKIDLIHQMRTAYLS
jgi:hypothetical protein